MKNEILKAAWDKWLTAECVDPLDKQTILSMDEDDLKMAFSEPMSFGTAGLRAVMGPGDSLMNVYTVAHFTTGVAELIAREGKEAVKAGVVIAYDSRNNSSLFARRAAEVLSAFGIRVYLFPSLRPTPVLSFAIRYLGCTAGINVTASHNGKEYNGYKLYWKDGIQISPEQARTVSATVAAKDIFLDVPSSDEANERLILSVPEEVDEAYLRAVLSQAVDPTVISRAADKLRVVYTPLYGAGHKMVPEILRRSGLTKLFLVEEQMTPSGMFETTPQPNPENKEVFTLGIELAKEANSDLLIATDPDADRIGAMVRDRAGEYRVVSGNQMGALLLEYMISAYRENGTMPPDPFVVKSFVTTDLAKAICLQNGVSICDVLTGFKYIGEKIKQAEESGRGSFLFGFEESYGYLKGTHARDKDAVVTAMLIVEMAAYYRLKGKSLFDALEALYGKYGYYAETLTNIHVRGVGANALMKEMMASLREAPPKVIGGSPVVSCSDYLAGTATDRQSGETISTGLPTADALEYVIAGGTKIVIRPSGTEAKVKVYVMTKGDSEADANAKAKAALESVKLFFE